MTGWLWILLTVVGVALLGLALARGSAVTRQRRDEPVRSAAPRRQTEALYEQEEAQRKREEGPASAPRR